MGLIRGIQMFLFVFVLFTVTEEHIPSFTVEKGDEVTLPCANVTENQQNCVNTSWFVREWPGREMELLTQGNMSRKTNSISDRSSVTADCSLVITEVKRGDAGHYTCRQFKPGEHYQDAHVSLSGIHIERWWSFEEVKFVCNVETYDGCWHSLKWLYNGSMTDPTTPSDSCSAKITFPISYLKQKSDVDELLYCNVTDKRSGETLLCDVKFPSSCRKPGSPSSGRNQTAEEDSPINKAVTEEHVPSFTVEYGDEVILPCGNVTENQQNCDSISWFIREWPYSSLKLLTQGNKIEGKNSKSDRFRVTVNCSLVITKVEEDDGGLYTCRQFKPGEHAQDAHVSLSVIGCKYSYQILSVQKSLSS
ncbi:uncharacterized protein LOC121521169 [Cheilinus undulatus]|uniref:uncharacterized protein LOC121521169 n=1 Tax=Cheilinus undulatus TaxID=241271 RepID=UPI001BD47398|nr:uncharacterized protein LOC121521169 [Cheilinus undulatus]